MMRTDLKDFLGNTRAAKKVLVVDLGFLGDTIHLLPSLWEIKQHYPKAELQVLTSPVGCEVLRMAACVDRSWKFPLGPPSPKWWEHLDVLRALRRERFDVIFNFSGADRSVFVERFINAPHAMAYQGARKHFWQPWFVRNWIARTPLPGPVYEGRRHILSLCGFTLQPPKFGLTVPAEGMKWAEENIPAGSVHLSLNASFALKEWPMANNLALVRFLFASGLDRKLVVTAAPNPREQARLEQLRREINDPRLLLLTERLTITKLAAMLERCVLHVGPDSGMIHLAAALNIPTIAIFRQYWDMTEWLPVGPQHVHFDAPCVCMGNKQPPCAVEDEAACLAGIAPELVGREILKRLAVSSPKPTP